MNNMINTMCLHHFIEYYMLIKFLNFKNILLTVFFPAVSYRLPLAVTMSPEQQKPGRSNSDT